MCNDRTGSTMPPTDAAPESDPQGATTAPAPAADGGEGGKPDEPVEQPVTHAEQAPPAAASEAVPSSAAEDPEPKLQVLPDEDTQHGAAADSLEGVVDARLAGVGDRLDGVGDRLDGMGERLDGVGDGLQSLEDRLGALAQQQELLTGQVRQMRIAVSDAATSLSAPRVRDFLNTLLQLHDLLDQSLSGAGREGTGSSLEGDLQVVHGQVLQALRLNDLEEIPTDGPFDPTIHRAMQAVAPQDDQQLGQIVRVARKGFRSPSGVLRYAEVVVTSDAAASAPSGPDEGPKGQPPSGGEER